MDKEQKIHDIAIAFASVKMQARINSDNDESLMTLERQMLEFMTNYSFASCNAAVTHALAETLDKK